MEHCIHVKKQIHNGNALATRRLQALKYVAPHLVLHLNIAHSLNTVITAVIAWFCS